MPSRLFLLPVLALILAMSCACVRQREAVDAEIRVLREGALTPMECKAKPSLKKITG